MNAPADCIRFVSLDLQQRVKLSLAHRNLELGRLSVEMSGPETIHLSKVVRLLRLQELAVATAKRVAGVRHVSDGIRILTIQTAENEVSPAWHMPVSVPTFDSPALAWEA